MRALAAILIIATCNTVIAQTYCVDGRCYPTAPPTVSRTRTAARPTPGIVRVRMEKSPGVFANGTGVLLHSDGFGIVATAAHVTKGTRKGVITFHDGRQYGAVLVEEDHTNDVATLRIDQPHIRRRLLADSAPDVGSQLYCGGWSVQRGNGYAVHRGTTVDSAGDTLARGGLGIIDGDSGGPIWDANGKIVSVLAQIEYPTHQPQRRVFRGCRLQILRGMVQRAIAPFKRPPIRQQCPLPGDTPAPQTPAPAPADPAPTPNKITITSEQLQIVADAVIAHMEANPGKFRGPPGRDGAPGPAGPAGPSPAVDIDLIAAKVSRKLPDLHVQILDSDGTVLQDHKAPLGQPVKFQLVPVGR